jgi:DNA-binding GntR family transcriptional regulator
MDTATNLKDRIFSDIATRIERDLLKPGDQIPTARDLGIQYACSQTPVAGALQQLKTDGYVAGHQGRGTYVIDAWKTGAPDPAPDG